MKLKTKIMALNLSVLILVGTMLFLQFRAAQNKQKFEIRKGFAQVSEKLQRAVSTNFYLFYHNVQNFSLNGALKNKDSEGSKFFFNELMSLYPLYDFILFVDKDGNLISSNDLSNDGKKLKIENLSTNFSETTWFKALKEGKLVEDYEKKIYGSYFGPLLESNISKALYGESKRGNIFATSVSDDFGEVIGYLVSGVNENWILHEIKGMNNSLKREGKENAHIWLLNNEGLVLSELNNDKLIFNNFRQDNILDSFKEDIEVVTNLKEPSFIKSMFIFDKHPLYAFSKFKNDKFVESIGWMFLVEMESQSAFSAIEIASDIFSISFFLTLGIAAFFAFYVSTKLSNNLLSIAKNVEGGSVKIADASQSLSEHSVSLSGATADQASSLQQTVASLNEISAMVNKNTEASHSSKDLSGKSRHAAETGKGTIDKMLSSIDEISDANGEIIDQMGNNTQEIQGIINVIRNIEEKTKVINDIVFQTKLLSFNVSVEAARAGEHGKGFSVVAEEVGNLAQHSGDAAKEIEEMLAESVGKVESIAKNTETKVQELIKKGTSKVEQGKEVARQCDDALEQILDYANTLDGMIEEITIASVEQSQGIQEISKAMTELDKVTKKNSMIAQESSLNTKTLNEQVKDLKDISVSLTDLISGKVTSNNTSGKKEHNLVTFKAKDKTTMTLESKDDNRSNHEDKIVSFESKKKAKIENKKDAISELKTTNVEKKVASSDISVPSHHDGEWEDI